MPNTTYDTNKSNPNVATNKILKVVYTKNPTVTTKWRFKYVTKDDYVKPSDLLDEFENLLITKTFSKIHGLASIRVGYGIANPSLIEVLNRIRQPFNVNAIAQAMASIAINDHEHIRKSIELNSQQNEFLFDQLTKLGLDCIPSVGNFITFKGNFSGREMFNKLMKKGVIVRSVDLYDMKDFKFLKALEELL